eukprot:4479264-Amphidinium_carterae.1
MASGLQEGLYMSSAPFRVLGVVPSSLTLTVQIPIVNTIIRKYQFHAPCYVTASVVHFTQALAVHSMLTD